ncbi:hypothetical protein T492DRAFT_832619 [Pavlovales sp. CCMP2436]|nr:hypothetical protein T492DRAFT_832619 [Pavlovales sp. CCMP2436]
MSSMWPAQRGARIRRRPAEASAAATSLTGADTHGQPVWLYVAAHHGAAEGPAARYASRDALREQKKQKETAKLAELESEFVLCETVYACGVAPCEIAMAKRCLMCRTIAESGRACGKYDSVDRSGSREAIESESALRTQPS